MQTAGWVSGNCSAAAGSGTLKALQTASMARTRVTTLRSRCRVGYRDQRISELAGMFASGEVDPAWFEDPDAPDGVLVTRDIVLESGS